MTDDISKKTIFIFLILTIFVSILSTWTLLSNVHQKEMAEVPTTLNSFSSGKVSFEVQAKPEPVNTKAVVSFTVK